MYLACVWKYPQILNGYYNGFAFIQVDQDDFPEKENFCMDQMDEMAKQKCLQKPFSGNRTTLAEGMMKKKMTKEERILAAEEKRLQREVRALDYTDSVPNSSKR